jgi:hypothetical protein
VDGLEEENCRQVTVSLLRRRRQQQQQQQQHPCHAPSVSMCRDVTTECRFDILQQPLRGPRHRRQQRPQGFKKLLN